MTALHRLRIRRTRWTPKRTTSEERRAKRREPKQTGPRIHVPTDWTAFSGKRYARIVRNTMKLMMETLGVPKHMLPHHPHPDCPTAYRGCTCACHFSPGMRHCVPCCHP